METELQEKKEKIQWTHFGSAFLGEKISYTQVPRGIYPVLDKMGFKPGRDRVVIALVRRLRPTSFRVYFSHKQLMLETNLSRRTVHTVIKQIRNQGARKISFSDDEFGHRSCLDLMGFIAKIAEIHESIEKEKVALDEARNDE